MKNPPEENRFANNVYLSCVRKGSMILFYDKYYADTNYAYDIEKKMLIENYKDIYSEEINKVNPEFNIYPFFAVFENGKKYVYTDDTGTKIYTCNSDLTDKTVLFDSKEDFFIRTESMQINENNDIIFNYDFFTEEDDKVIFHLGVGILDGQTLKLTKLPNSVLAGQLPTGNSEKNLLVVLDCSNFYPYDGPYICKQDIINLDTKEIIAVIPENEFTYPYAVYSDNYFVKVYSDYFENYQIAIYDLKNLSYPLILTFEKYLEANINTLAISEDGKILDLFICSYGLNNDFNYTVYPLNLNELKIKVNPVTSDKISFIINASIAVASFIIFMILFNFKIKRWII
jgi:hypothetical protein